MASQNRYLPLIEKIFFERYSEGATELEFARTDLEEAAATLGINLPKNLGDVIYAIRYRIEFPEEILATQPEGMQWIIEGAGKAQYLFKLVKVVEEKHYRLVPASKISDKELRRYSATRS